MKRPSYRAAIQWLADNDDCAWLHETDGPSALSVSAALVADMFGVDDVRVRADLTRAIDRAMKEAA